MSREGALWIGGLEPYMDEEFLLQAMRSSGEDNILSIKVIKNKFTGGVAGYGFINFPSDSIALTAMHKLNGKMIPNSRPPARYKLNHNSNRILPGEKNYSIWVGDLSPEIDDLMLYKFFSARFQTIISAKGHFSNLSVPGRQPTEESSRLPTPESWRPLRQTRY